jgi:hypothetical protein
MSLTSLEKLYSKLKSKEFSTLANGRYNYHLFLYPASEEYKWRHDILEIKKKLIKPADYIDTLVLNIFDEFCDFLDRKPFGSKYSSLLKYLLDKESKGDAAIEQVQNSLSTWANSDEFIQHIHARIMDHVNKQDDNLQRPYVFFYGLGQIYPYLRTSTFLTKYERLNKINRYKIILFFPGTSTNNGMNFKLFGLLSDDHNYRSHLLINEDA